MVNQLLDSSCATPIVPLSMIVLRAIEGVLDPYSVTTYCYLSCHAPHLSTVTQDLIARSRLLKCHPYDPDLVLVLDRRRHCTREDREPAHV